MSRIETIKNLDIKREFKKKARETKTSIDEMRLGFALGMVNKITPNDPTEPPVTKESLMNIQEQMNHELQADGQSRVLVDFSLKHGHNV